MSFPITTPSTNNKIFLAAFLLIYSLALYVHLFFGDYDLNIAWRGFSALDFSNSVVMKHHFINDYPGGAGGTGASLLSWVYPVAQTIGIPLIHFFYPLMVGLEILSLWLGAILFLHTISPRSSHQRTIMMLVAITLLALSNVRNPNLARFGNPFFHGQFYGFADGAAFAAIAYFLSNRFVKSTVTLMLGFTIHPIKTLFASFFIGAGGLANCRVRVNLKFFVAYGLFGFFSLLWMIGWLDFFSKDYSTLTHKEFYRFAKLMNHHWFPQNLGILTWRADQYAIPSLGALLAGTVALFRSSISKEIKEKLYWGLFICFAVTVFGLFVSWYELSPTLTRISPQRISVLGLGIISIILTMQTVDDLSNKRFGPALLGSSILTAAFFMEGWPIILCLAYALTIFETRSESPNHARILLLFTGGGFLLYFTWLFRNGYKVVLYLDYQLLLLCGLTGILSLIGFFPDILQRIHNSLKPDRQWTVSLIIIIFLLSCGYYWGIENRTLSSYHLTKAQAYKDVQLWARKNTPTQSLFMADPCQNYGWRDFSQRSSFGSIGEWFKNSFVYSDNQSNLYEGIRRGRVLNIDVDTVIPEDSHFHPHRVWQLLCKPARKAYYRQDGKKLDYIAQEFGVDYFVFDKQLTRQYGSIPNRPIFYQNDSYVVLKPRL